MLTVVAGTGYTGGRILERLPADSVVGLSRTRVETARSFHTIDFDAPDAPLPDIAAPGS